MMKIIEDQEERIVRHLSNSTGIGHNNPIPLAIDEDPNWLSEYLCFVRLELVELFEATHGYGTTKKITNGQVSLRCRFCAKLPLRAVATLQQHLLGVVGG